jgi:methionine-rich copper-binding protein CopC
MKQLLRTLVLVLFLLLVPASAAAHGTIYTYKYIDGDNLVMVTHNVHDAQAGAPVTYNLRLFTLEGELATFDKVVAEIKRDAKTVGSKTVGMSEYQDANFQYAYPKPGSYVLSIAFLDHDKHIAKGEFPIVVGKSANSSFFAAAFTLHTVAAFVLGASLAALLFWQRKRLKLLARLKPIYKKR